MLRVGYPQILDPELLSVMPEGVELVPLGDSFDHPVDIDVWIPDPYSTRALRAWPHLRGVRLVLSMMAGTEPGDRYRMANRLAARFAGRLEEVFARRGRFDQMRSLLCRFYGAGQAEKIELARAA